MKKEIRLFCPRIFFFQSHSTEQNVTFISYFFSLCHPTFSLRLFYSNFSDFFYFDRKRMYLCPLERERESLYGEPAKSWAACRIESAQRTYTAHPHKLRLFPTQSFRHHETKAAAAAKKKTKSTGQSKLVWTRGGTEMLLGPNWHWTGEAAAAAEQNLEREREREREEKKAETIECDFFLFFFWRMRPDSLRPQDTRGQAQILNPLEVTSSRARRYRSVDQETRVHSRRHS